jgi:hypothetical protein
MTPFTQMTLALNQESLMALRANDADGPGDYRSVAVDQIEGRIAKYF